jgi:hypothetical protein
LRSSRAGARDDQKGLVAVLDASALSFSSDRMLWIGAVASRPKDTRTAAGE